MSRAAFIQVSVVVLAAVAAAALSAFDGDLDPTFGDGGVVALTGHAGISAVTFGPNGEVLLAMHDGPSIEIARLLANGDPDLLFHGDGFRTLGLTSDEEATALAAQTDGKILVAGNVHMGPMANDDHLLVARLTSGGFLDSSFGGGSGWTSVDFDPISSGRSTAAQALIQPDGKIVAIGEAYTVPILPEMADFELAVARFMPDGALDPDFRGGTVLVPFDLIPGGDETSGGGALLADGSLLLVGTAEVGVVDSHVVAAKLDPGGQLDPTFGIGGKTSFVAPLLEPIISGVVVQPDGSSRGQPSGLPTPRPEEQETRARALPVSHSSARRNRSILAPELSSSSPLTPGTIPVARLRRSHDRGGGCGAHRHRRRCRGAPTRPRHGWSPRGE